MIYKWEIEDLIKKPSIDGLSEVVTHVSFACTGIDDVTGKEHTYHHFIKLPPPAHEDFIDFNSLTEEQVVSWVKSKVDLDLVYGIISQRIEMESVDVVKMPWGYGRNDHYSGN